MLNETECTICNDTEEYAYSELVLVKCKNCDAYFHRMCYGIQSHNASTYGVVILCDPCNYELQTRGRQLSRLSSTKSLKCIICFNPGILKRVLIPKNFSLFANPDKSHDTHNRAIWIHVECAIYSHRYITIGNWRSISSIEVLEPLPYKSEHPCSICKLSRGLVKKCCSPNCAEHFHIHCIMRSSSYKHKNIKVDVDHILDVYCAKHSNPDSQIPLKSCKSFRKSVIECLRQEIKTFESSPSLEGYVSAVIMTNNGELFSTPSFVYSENFIGLTLQSIIASSDIWALRTSAFLSLASVPPVNSCLTRFAVSHKAKIEEWISFSRFISTNPRYFECLTYISRQISDLIEDFDKHGRIRIPNNALYYVVEVRQLLEAKSIQDWEKKHLEDYTALKKKSGRRQMNTSRLRRILEDIPVGDQTDPLGEIRRRSGLYLTIMSIFSRMRMLDAELGRTLRSRTLNVDRLRYISKKIESGIPKDSAIKNGRYKRVLAYCVCLEGFFTRRMERLKSGSLRECLGAPLEERLGRSFGDLSDRMEELRGRQTIIDQILDMEIGLAQAEAEAEAVPALDLEEAPLGDCRRVLPDSAPRKCISLSWVARSRLITGKVTSGRMRSTIRELSRLREWEGKVNSSFEMLAGLERTHSSYKKLSRTNEHLSIRDRYRKLLAILSVFESRTEAFMECVASVSRAFGVNRELLARSKAVIRYSRVLDAHNRVLELEGILERESDPSLGQALLYLDHILGSEFCLVPRRRSQAAFLKRLEAYVSFEGYAAKSLETGQVFFTDLVILDKFLSHKSGEFSRSEADGSLGIFQDLDALLSKLLDKAKENFCLTSRIHLMLSSFGDDPDYVFSVSRSDLDLRPVIRHFTEEEGGGGGGCKFETATKGFLSYIKVTLGSDSGLGGHLERREVDGRRPFASCGSGFSLESYRKLFFDVVGKTDLCGDLCVPERQELEVAVIVPPSYRLRLIQRYYVMEAFSLIASRDSPFASIRDLVERTIQTASLDVLVMIWRRLRQLDARVGLFEGLGREASRPEEEEEAFTRNDVLYVFAMKLLTDFISASFLWKRSIFGSVDDYLRDMEYITENCVLGESERRHFASEAGEVRQLDSAVKQVVQKISQDDFGAKKRIIEEILGCDLALREDSGPARDPGREDGPEAIFVHQPLSFEEDAARERLLADFPAKKKNEFFSRMRAEDLFHQESVAIIECRRQSVLSFSGDGKESPGARRDKYPKSLAGLMEEYLSLVEEERNGVLLTLGRASRFSSAAGPGNGEEETQLRGLESLFRDLAEETETTSSRIALLNHLLSDLMHLEIAFVAHLVRMNQTGRPDGAVRPALREWFNDNYLRDKSPYKLFRGTRILPEMRCCAASLPIFSLIRQVSVQYLEMVESWDRSYSRIVHERRESEFYDVLLAYSQSGFLKRLLDGDLDSVSSKLSPDSSSCEASYREKCDFIDKEYRRLRALLGDFMVPFKRHMNGIFSEIATNGLYDVGSSTRFLFYFPSSLVETLRTRGSSRYPGSAASQVRLEDISVVYFSRERSLLLARVNIDYRSEYYYLSPGLLVALSSEISLQAGILRQPLLMESYQQFVRVYRDSFVREHYFYVRRSGVSEHLADHINKRLVDFEREVRLRAAPSRTRIRSHTGRPRRRRIDLSLEPFKVPSRGGGLGEEKLIVVSDIIDLVYNVLAYRIFLSGLLADGRDLDADASLFRHKSSLLDFDLALKTLVMCFSMRELVDEAFPRLGRGEPANSLFAPPELFGVLKELSALFETLNAEEVCLRTRRRPKVHHFLFEKEQMLMEDFRTWEIASDRYLFKKEQPCEIQEDSASGTEFFSSPAIWVPEYENFSTVLEVVDLILVYARRIRYLVLDPQDTEEVSGLVRVLEAKRNQILELEGSSLRTLRSIREEESQSGRWPCSDLEPHLLLERIIPPPRTSQKAVLDLVSRKVSEVLPGFKFISGTLNILPYKGFEMLTKYLDDSVMLDRSIKLAMDKIANMGRSESSGTRRSSLEDVLSHNLEYVLKVVDLRRQLSASKLVSETQRKAHMMYFKGIMRYFFLYGSNTRWVKIPESPRADGAQEAREAFVPILEYGVLRRLYREVLLWHKHGQGEECLREAFRSSEFVILESLLSSCKHLMEMVSFSLEKRGKEYLSNLCALRYLYYLDEENEAGEEQGSRPTLTSMIGLLDVGEYLSEFLGLLDKELTLAQESFWKKRGGSSREEEDVLELGSCYVFSKRDNRLVHHYLKRSKISVSVGGSRSAKHGLLSNMYYIKENRERLAFMWSLTYISRSMHPASGVYFIRKYVKQYLDYIFSTFYGKDADIYAAKKNNLIYLESLPREEISEKNLFRILSHYLKAVFNYSLVLIQKAFKARKSMSHLSYSNLSVYPDQLERLRSRWLVFESENWISERMQQSPGQAQSRPESDWRLAIYSMKGRTRVLLERSRSRKLLARSARHRLNKRERDFSRDSSEERSLERRFGTGRSLASSATASEKKERPGVASAEKTSSASRSLRRRRENHQGLKSSLKFMWLGWLGLGSGGDEAGLEEAERKRRRGEEGETLEIGMYQVSRQFTKKSEDILRELNDYVDLKYNGVKHSLDVVERALRGNSVVVLISSNWSQHLGSCRSQIFSRIFYYNYDHRDYEVFEFELVDEERGDSNTEEEEEKKKRREDICNETSSISSDMSDCSSNSKESNGLKDDIRLLVFPCNLNEEEDNNRLLFGRGPTQRETVPPLPISRHYLIGMVVLKSEISEHRALDKREDEEISMVASLLPGQEQMKKIAQCCHNMSVKSGSNMEFLVNCSMFSSAKTLLSSLLSLNDGCFQETPQSSRAGEKGRDSSNIQTLQDLANSIKQRISEG